MPRMVVLLSLFVININTLSQGLDFDYEIGQSLIGRPGITWLNKKWTNNDDVLDQIENALCAGRVIQIKNALDEDIANKLAKELSESSNWEEYVSNKDTFVPLPRSIFSNLKESFVCERVQKQIADYKHHKSERTADAAEVNNSSQSMGYYYTSNFSPPTYIKSDIYQHRMHAIHNQSNHPATMTKLKELFSSTVMMQLFSKLSRSHLTKHNLNPTWYRPGDHITIHNDKVKNRRVSYILHLGIDSISESDRFKDSKQPWNANNGGNLVWCDPPEVLVPTFNSLTIFSVSSRSYHFVEPVWLSTQSSIHEEEGRNMEKEEVCYTDDPRNENEANEHRSSHVSGRFAVSGFYFADEDEVSYWNSFAVKSVSLPYPTKPALFVD